MRAQVSLTGVLGSLGDITCLRLSTQVLSSLWLSWSKNVQHVYETWLLKTVKGDGFRMSVSMILVNIFNACSLIFLLCLSQILTSHLSMGLWIRALSPGRPAAVLSIHSPRHTCPTTCHPTCSRPTNPSSHKVRRKRQAGDSSVSKRAFVNLCFLWLHFYWSVLCPFVCHLFVLWEIKIYICGLDSRPQMLPVYINTLHFFTNMNFASSSMLFSQVRWWRINTIRLFNTIGTAIWTTFNRRNEMTLYFLNQCPRSL